MNHLPNSHLLTNKLGLLNSLKEYERVTLSTKGRLPRLKMSEFHPETYKLDEKGDRELFLEVYKGKLRTTKIYNVKKSSTRENFLSAVIFLIFLLKTLIVGTC